MRKRIILEFQNTFMGNGHNGLKALVTDYLADNPQDRDRLSGGFVVFLGSTKKAAKVMQFQFDANHNVVLGDLFAYLKVERGRLSTGQIQSIPTYFGAEPFMLNPELRTRINGFLFDGLSAARGNSDHSARATP